MTRAVYVGPWRIDVTVRDDVRLPVSTAQLARAAGRTLDASNAPAPASIGLILSGDGELATLNAEHLGHRGPTDVLSFPLLPPDAYPPHPGRQGGETGASAPTTRFVLPPGRRVHLGEIVISVERAVQQAASGRGGQTGDILWSPADELRLLVTHGVLHLCGWDHAEPAEEAAMRSLEVRLLAT